MKVADTKRPFLATFHAPNTESALSRYVVNVMAANENVSRNYVMNFACNTIKFVVNQRILVDGTKKVVRIDEIRGTEERGEITVPVINPIFKFIPDSNGLDAEKKINGMHVQVGTISESTQKLLLEAGATKDEIEILVRKASPENVIAGSYDI